MVWSFLLYGIAIILLIYIFVRLILPSRKFGIREALAALAIDVSIILALRIGPPVIPPPQATRTPSPPQTPMPTSISDDFNNYIYDGGFNQNIWDYWGVIKTNIHQQQGRLIISADSVIQPRIVAKSFSSFSLNVPMYFEAKLRESSLAHSGAVNMKISTSLSGDNYWETECNISALSIDQKGLAYCSVGTENGTEYDLPGKSVEFDNWYTFRIEVDPTTMNFSYFIDGQNIGSHIPKDSATLRNSKFSITIGAHSVAKKLLGYVDDVMIILK